MKSLRNSLLHQLDQCRHDLLRVVPLDEIEILTRVCFPHVRHLTSTNAVRSDDDPAIRCLPEYFCEPHNWHHTALDQVMEHRAGPNRGKLVYVADQNQRGVVGNSP